MDIKIDPLPDEYKKYIGPLVVTVLSLLPVALWVVAKPIEDRFFSIEATALSFGQIAGLVGMALFSVAMILSARLKIITRYFDGLNKEYSTHHTAGIISFILLMAHPLILSFGYLRVSVSAMAQFLLPRNDLAINFGIIALIGLVVLILITLFAKFKYEVLFTLHKFLGLVFVFASVHMLLAPGDLRSNPPLAAYMSLLMAAGIVAFFYRTLLGHFAVSRFSYRVVGAREVGDDVLEIEMEPVGEKIPYRAGQFIFINYVSDTVNTEAHPFSLSSGAEEANVKVAIKNLGDYTKGLFQLEKGSTAEIEGPFGRFFYEYESIRDKVWIAGGIGVTPFLSMARTMRSKMENEYRVFFFYSVKKKSEFVFLDELIAISKVCKWFIFIPYCTDQSGFLTAQIIDKMTRGVRKKDIYICGPLSMMKALGSQFIKLRVPKRHIHMEQFKLL
ncbi:MAG TPA: ferric reductase-like transmembrane domain-containing protein [Candidatus Paceibacterota bacterium]